MTAVVIVLFIVFILYKMLTSGLTDHASVDFGVSTEQMEQSYNFAKEVEQHLADVQAYLLKESARTAALEARVTTLESHMQPCSVAVGAPVVGRSPAPPASSSSFAVPPADTRKADLQSALSGLGFKNKQAQAMTAKVLSENPDAELTDLLRAALKLVGPPT